MFSFTDIKFFGSAIIYSGISDQFEFKTSRYYSFSFFNLSHYNIVL